MNKHTYYNITFKKMEYELNYFEELIAGRFQSENEELTSKKYRQIADKISSESIRIQKAFANKIFSLKDEGLMQMYVRHNQAGIVRLMDQLLHDYELIADDGKNKHKVNDKTASLAGNMLHTLDALLIHVENHYQKYFNTAEKIPESYRLKALREFKEKISSLCLNYAAFSDRELFKIAIYPIVNFQKHITFKRLAYLSELLTVIEDVRLEAREDEDKMQSLLMNNLIYINYNSFYFFAYLTHYILSTIQKLETTNDRVEKLLWFRKQVSQAPIKPGVQLKMKKASIKMLLFDWLTDELYFYEKKKQIWSKPASELNSRLPEDFKIKTDFSVPQVACFIKLLIESDVIKNENITETLHFYSAFTQTKNTTNISPESMRTKYYNIEDSTRKAIRDLLVKMLKDTNQHLLN